ncbi:MAG TPA: family 1 glycosylhydrolase [Candidatus Babeliales bacterium]|nr:family 1 glycosylhydrolase [Candidatus Babeliales bacterium]
MKQSILFFCLLQSLTNNAESPFFTRKEQGVHYPHGFLKGVASSTYQNGGHNYWESLGYRPKSNWTWFENNFHARFILNRERQGGTSICFKSDSPIDRGERVGTSADGWNRMFDDIQLIKDLNCNAYRFEIPWTDLNPQQGVWNEEAFDFFDRYIDALRDAGIEPIVTLYHWVHPLWFHKLKAWEKEENIIHFVRYCQEVFKRFGHKVTYWCTINEPTVVSVCGYIIGSHAPGKKDYASMLRPFCNDYLLYPFSHNYVLAGTVLGNLFKAHIEVYETLKVMPHGEQANISIIHQMAHFQPKIKGGINSVLNPISRMLAKQFNKNFAHKVFMRFFTTGHFVYDVPGDNPIKFVDKRAPHSLDFLGLNFYADMFFGPGPEPKEDEEMTDMTVWSIRPQAIYNAIKELSQLHVPIIITENGICDAKDDRREKWIIGYNNAVEQAIRDGYDVRGYCYWSLLDNYEWNMGHNKKFGLYAVNTLSNNLAQKDRILRKGSYAYRDYVQVDPA